ncbi:DUF5133 domain-containing protein [Streptomyces sp. AK02-01A]|uniref:DUF5133 domain-containing protein n=1 Tax=Streptomyces sp. AK02-01A TaxID=3028648 RepID=UPI0029ADEE33|nr:DUF5133 domain-containing protein [Streptomyces sp. AK02-01A]MDX3853981.1 DUF5133 domain-containing protein [Streptomyces sp. AK02-01A]
MLMAHPAILRNLVKQYEALQVLHAETDSFETRRRLEDITYTLCVSTGTRVVEDALAVAERQLAGALAEQAGASVTTGESVTLTV